MRGPIIAVCALACLACDPGKDAAGSEPASAAKSSEPEAEPPMSSFTAYQRKSMRSEAMMNTRMIIDLLRARFVGEGSRPVSIPVTPAAGSCCKQPEGVCAGEGEPWEAPAWKELGFRPGGTHRYSYQVDVEGDAITVTASADLDCDGTLSTYAYQGVISGEELEFNTDTPIETNALD